MQSKTISLDDKGNTELHIASQSNAFLIINQLLKSMSPDDINLKNNDGKKASALCTDQKCKDSFERYYTEREAIKEKEEIAKQRDERDKELAEQKKGKSTNTESTTLKHMTNEEATRKFFNPAIRPENRSSIVADQEEMDKRRKRVLTLYTIVLCVVAAVAFKKVGIPMIKGAYNVASKYVSKAIDALPSISNSI